MEALINEYRLEIIEHCWKYSNSHSSFINWILKFRKFLILAPAPSIFSGVSRKGRKVCHSFKCFKIGVLHIRSWSTFNIFLISEMAGVTMTLFCTHGRVSGPNSLLDHEVIAPCGYSVPCQFWPVVRRHGRGVLWAGGDPWVPACKPSLRAMLESDRYWWSLVLDYGTPERPWPTTMSMRSKA